MMNSECNRLETFKNWKRSTISSKILAKTGFYYLGTDDRVQCNFCNVILFEWKKDGDEIFEHQRLSSLCPFLKHHESTQNIPINPNNVELNDLLATAKYIYDYSEKEKKENNIECQYIAINKLEKKYYKVQKIGAVEINGKICIRIHLTENRITIIKKKKLDYSEEWVITGQLPFIDLKRISIFMRLYREKRTNRLYIYESSEKPFNYQSSERVAYGTLDLDLNPRQVLLFSIVKIDNEKRIRVDICKNQHFILPKLSEFKHSPEIKINKLEFWNKMRLLVYCERNSMLMFQPEEKFCSTRRLFSI